jgi:uncharacterized protein (DUF488 family)
MKPPMKIYTIGFTKKSAERFFELLEENQIGRLIDIRLRPGGQLAGFAKQDDLAYFLRELIGRVFGPFRRHLKNLSPGQGLGSLRTAV